MKTRINPGIIRVILRELGRMRRDPRSLLLMAALPLIAFGLIWGIFNHQVVRDLPAAVIDQDNSALSRSVIRAIDSTRSISLSETPALLSQGRNMVLQGKVYALVLIPENFERDVKTGRGGRVIGYYNAQMLLPGSVISADLNAAVSTVSAQLDALARMKKGSGAPAAAEQVEPIGIDRHVLFNPQLNYVYFLESAFWPTFLQLFVILAAVMAVCSEFKNNTQADWLAAAGGSLSKALAGKLSVYLVHYSLMGVAAVMILFGPLGVPLRGNIYQLLGATVLLVSACLGSALIMAGFLPSVRAASSAASFYAGAAFAFAGVTFPLAGMPPLARAWSQLLPLTHYLRLMTEIGLKGTAWPLTAPDFIKLAMFTLAGLAALPLVGRHFSRPQSWGRP